MRFRKDIEQRSFEARSGESSREALQSRGVIVRARGGARQIEDRVTKSARIGAIDCESEPVSTDEVTEKASIVHDHWSADSGLLKEKSRHSVWQGYGSTAHFAAARARSLSSWLWDRARRSTVAQVARIAEAYCSIAAGTPGAPNRQASRGAALSPA
jgi:hypothetical protein